MYSDPTNSSYQMGLFPNLSEFINNEHPLIKLGRKLPWKDIETYFAKFYSSVGRKAKPIRLMVGLLILKQMHNLSDEQLLARWCENPYFQVFCGINIFQWNFPCDPTDLIYFRQRIGEEGFEYILKTSVDIHGAKALENEIILDTTVQIKNITYPTDTKLHLKIIWRCIRLAKSENITLRRSYKTELKQLIRDARFDKSLEGVENANKAKTRIKEIARTLINEVRKKLNKSGNNKNNEDLDLYKRIVNQKKDDKNKIYSIHEPDVKCIAKGKSHINYEFGSKASVAITKDNCIIVGVKVFSDNCHDSKTVPDTLEQVKSITGKFPEIAIADRGYKGCEKYEEVNIEIPKNPKSTDSIRDKRIAKDRFKRRSAIEAVISHLKKYNGLGRNFLKGIFGDVVNLTMSAVAFNYKKYMAA